MVVVVVAALSIVLLFYLQLRDEMDKAADSDGNPLNSADAEDDG